MTIKRVSIKLLLSTPLTALDLPKILCSTHMFSLKLGLKSWQMMAKASTDFQNKLDSLASMNEIEVLKTEEYPGAKRVFYLKNPESFQGGHPVNMDLF